jgi:hypothetical protein
LRKTKKKGEFKMGKELVVKEVNVEALISQGLEKGAGIDVMERLFAMAKEAAAINAKRIYFESLAKFQSETSTINKTKAVDFTNKAGRKTHYAYAPLEDIVEQVKKNLKENGFSYTLKVAQDAASVTVTCEAHHEAGHTEESSVIVQIDVDAYMSGPQKVGAAITYAKRYAFCNAFGIMTGEEDTDAVDSEAEPTPKPAPKPDVTVEATEKAELKAKCAAEKITFSDADRAALSKITTAEQIKTMKVLLDLKKGAAEAGLKIDMEALNTKPVHERILELTAAIAAVKPKVG